MFLAFATAGSAAQQVPPRPAGDSARLGGRDTTTRDSTAKPRALTREDTIKAPLAAPYTPLALDLATTRSHWDRDSLYASGALTLGELLQQVPGVTFFTTGFLLAPQVASWYGDATRVRLFVDGVERDVLNRRNGGVTDFAAFPLWAIEDVVLERSALELRVHLRTWRVDRTSTSTRTDVLTGSENLNLYRWFFGKRSTSGLAIQFAGQQYSTASVEGMDGEALGLFARLGWAAGNWSTDVTFLRQGVNRNKGARFLATATPVTDAMPPWKGGESQAYYRAGWRDPAQEGPWVQLIAATTGSSVENSISTSSFGALRAGTPANPALQVTAADTSAPPDTSWTRTQYSLSGGLNRGALHANATARVRSIGGKRYTAPSVRADYDGRRLGIDAYVERTVDSLIRGDVRLRFIPFSWLSLGGGLGRESAPKGSGAAAFTTMRAEGALHLASAWLSGGVLSRGAHTTAPPVEIDTTLRSALVPSSQGITFGIRTPLVRGWKLDVDYVSWDGAVAYRPQHQARSKLWFSSSFLEAFPRGNFHVDAALVQEYRSALYLPDSAGRLSQATKPATVYSSLLEIRIGTAVLSWSYRNLIGTPYETWPGYVMPRLTSVYGVRWEFWN